MLDRKLKPQLQQNNFSIFLKFYDHHSFQILIVQTKIAINQLHNAFQWVIKLTKAANWMPVNSITIFNTSIHKEHNIDR